MDLAEKLEKRWKMREKVEDLYSRAAEIDDGVREYFDLESDKMLGKKIKVLSALIDGKGADEIGKDYFDVLEGFDQSAVEDGQIARVGDWEFDPSKK